MNLAPSHKLTPSQAAIAAGQLDAAPTQRTGIVFLWASIPLLVLFMATRARTVTGEDCGELVSAAYTLGIAHPPGSPIWVMLTKGFQTVFSGVNPADAAALGSSITTAVALGLLAVFAFRLTRSRIAAIFAAFATGVGHEIWNHATIAEVYPLNLLVLAGALILFERWREAPSASRFFWLTLLYGVGLANHPTFHLFLPLFGLAAIWVRPRILRDWRTLAVGFAGLAVPHLAYIQVYLAARAGAFVTWGVEPTLRSIVAHYLREVYGTTDQKTPLQGAKLLEQLRVVAQYHVDELTLLGWVAAVAGVVLLVRRDRKLGVLLLSMVALGTFGLVPFARFNLEREEMFAFRVFLMPAYLLLGVGLAMTVAALIRRLPATVSPRLAWALLLVPIASAAVRYSAHDRSNYRLVDDYAHMILDRLPKNAVLFPGGDTSTFPVIYLQCCEHLRPDVLMADRSGTVEREAVLAILPERTRREMKDAPREALTEALATVSGRPVVTMRPERLNERLGIQFAPFGIGFIAVGAKDDKAKSNLDAFQAEFFADAKFRNDADPTVEDYSGDIVRGQLAQARAEWLFRTGRPQDALKECEAVARHCAGLKENLNNLGTMLAENGMPEAGEPYFREALAIRGDYALARRNLVVILRGSGRFKEALAEIGKGLGLDPANEPLFRDGTELASDLGDGDSLRAICEARMKAVPDDAAAYRTLAEWQLNHDHSPLLARMNLEEAVKRDPTDKQSAQKLKDLAAKGDMPDVPNVAAERGDESATLARLLRPRVGVDLGADRAPGRLRRAPESDASFVPGADHVRSLLEQLDGRAAIDPLAGMNLPVRSQMPNKPDVPRRGAGPVVPLVKDS